MAKRAATSKSSKSAKSSADPSAVATETAATRIACTIDSSNEQYERVYATCFRPDGKIVAVMHDMSSQVSFFDCSEPAAWRRLVTFTPGKDVNLVKPRMQWASPTHLVIASDFGYVVVDATTPDEATTICEKEALLESFYATPTELYFTDGSMPKINATPLEKAALRTLLNASTVRLAGLLVVGETLVVGGPQGLSAYALGGKEATQIGTALVPKSPLPAALTASPRDGVVLALHRDARFKVSHAAYAVSITGPQPALVASLLPGHRVLCHVLDKDEVVLVTTNVDGERVFLQRITVGAAECRVTLGAVPLYDLVKYGPAQRVSVSGDQVRFTTLAHVKDKAVFHDLAFTIAAGVTAVTGADEPSQAEREVLRALKEKTGEPRAFVKELKLISGLDAPSTAFRRRASVLARQGFESAFSATAVGAAKNIVTELVALSALIASATDEHAELLIALLRWGRSPPDQVRKLIFAGFEHAGLAKALAEAEANATPAGALNLAPPTAAVAKLLASTALEADVAAYFAFLVQDAGAEKDLAAIAKRACRVVTDSDGLVITFDDESSRLVCAPPSDAKDLSAWPPGFQAILSRHRSLTLEGAAYGEGFVLEANAESNVAWDVEPSQKSPLGCPIWTYDDLYAFHPTEKTADGEPAIALLSHEDVRLHHVERTHIGTFFLRMMLKSLGPAPAKEDKATKKPGKPAKKRSSK